MTAQSAARAAVYATRTAQKEAEVMNSTMTVDQAIAQYQTAKMNMDTAMANLRLVCGPAAVAQINGTNGHTNGNGHHREPTLQNRLRDNTKKGECYTSTQLARIGKTTNGCIHSTLRQTPAGKMFERVVRGWYRRV